MTSDKQIEEMARVMCQSQSSCDMCNVNSPCRCRTNALLLNAEGYRKASEVAEDIIRILRAAGINEWRYPVVAEIRKKYTEGAK